MAAPAFAFVVLFAIAQPSTGASEFLAQSVARQVVEDMLLEEVPTAGQNGKRLPTIQEELMPMFSALPKNKYGRLEPPTVRYALHRYFVQRYGWYVKGLDPLGDGWNGSSPEGVMKDKVPAYIQSMFEGRLSGYGMNVTELAIFTATLADIIERDAALGLEHIYHVLGMSTSGSVSEEEFDAAVRVFIARFILGSAYPVRTKGDVESNEQELEDTYPDWNLTTMWAVDLRRTLDFGALSGRNPFVSQPLTFDSAASMLQRIMHNVATLAKYECPSLKAKLLELEVGDTGRVRLSDFYTSGVVPILDSPEFLQHLGVVDDTDPNMPMLIIPNYMVSQSNCIAESGYYFSCCLDECEGLLGHIERALAAPSATPESIVGVVAALPSDSQEVPRNLSSSLLARLNEVAEFHGGLVPLHGRLFMQWMHHAYPRECPWPLVSGTSKPLSQDEWMDVADRDNIEATREELDRYIAMSKRLAEGGDIVEAQAIPWVVVEELIAKHQPFAEPEHTHLGGFFHAAMALVALASVAVPLIRTSGLLSDEDPGKVHKV